MSKEDLEKSLAEAMGMPWVKPTHGPCCTCQKCGHDHNENWVVAKGNCQCGISEDFDLATQALNYSKLSWHIHYNAPLNCYDISVIQDNHAEYYEESKSFEEFPKAICKALLDALNYAE